MKFGITTHYDPLNLATNKIGTNKNLTFWATVCKRIRAMLSDDCLPVSPVCNISVLWPNGWTDQDETWHAGRPRPWPHCVIWGPGPPPQRGTDPNFPTISVVAKWLDGSRFHLLGRYIGHDPSDIVLDGDLALPPPKRGQSPPTIFGPCLLCPNGCINQDATCYDGKPWPGQHC